MEYKYVFLVFSFIILILGCKDKKPIPKNNLYKENEINEPIIEEKKSGFLFLPYIDGLHKYEYGISTFEDRYGNYYDLYEYGKTIYCGLYTADIDILLQVKDYINSLTIKDKNPISDISFLETFTQLKHLEIKGKNIENLEQLGNIKNLEKLTIGRDYPHVINCSIFKNFENLKYLELTNSKYINIESILNIPNLDIYTDNFYKGESDFVPILELGKYHILQDKVNVRTEATGNIDVIAILNLHDEIEILENSWIGEEINKIWGYWYKIKHGNIVGYIFGGDIAVKTFITDIDKNGINDYFYYRYSNRTEPTVFFYPFRDVIIYINNKKINTNNMSKNKEFFNGKCNFEEKDGYVLVVLDGYARDDEYYYSYKILPNGNIEYINDR